MRCVTGRWTRQPERLSRQVEEHSGSVPSCAREASCNVFRAHRVQKNHCVSRPRRNTTLRFTLGAISTHVRRAPSYHQLPSGGRKTPTSLNDHAPDNFAQSRNHLGVPNLTSSGPSSTLHPALRIISAHTLYWSDSADTAAAGGVPLALRTCRITGKRGVIEQGSESRKGILRHEEVVRPEAATTAERNVRCLMSPGRWCSYSGTSSPTAMQQSLHTHRTTSVPAVTGKNGATAPIAGITRGAGRINLSGA